MSQCNWRKVAPEGYKKSAPLCTNEALYRIIRSNDMDMPICSEHLWCYLALKGPQRIELEIGQKIPIQD